MSHCHFLPPKKLPTYVGLISVTFLALSGPTNNTTTTQPPLQQVSFHTPLSLPQVV
jgi:hypothetical protein